jgi:RNA polymerase sigma-70 factor, ECF subfamily
MDLQKLYTEYQPLLFSIAYRMLGTVSDAEDIVQDVYLHVKETDLNHVKNMRAFLCKMVTNRCLDFLKSASKKREVYIGPWLPEPLILQENDPYYEVIKKEEISFALLLILDQLKPVERAVFILREVLNYDYADIGEIVGKNETHCRKIFSRVKEKFPFTHESKLKTEVHREKIIHTFLSAINQGDFQQLENLLSQDVVLYSDGGGKVYAALKPIHSKTFVLRFIMHLLTEFKMNERIEPSLNIVNVNGQTGFLITDHEQIRTVVSFHVEGEVIKEIYLVRNPEKLNHIY